MQISKHLDTEDPKKGWDREGGLLFAMTAGTFEGDPAFFENDARETSSVQSRREKVRYSLRRGSVGPQFRAKLASTKEGYLRGLCGVGVPPQMRWKSAIPVCQPRKSATRDRVPKRTA